MTTLALIIALAALAVAVTNAVVQHKRHRALARRIERVRRAAAIGHNLLMHAYELVTDARLRSRGNAPPFRVEFHSQHGEEAFILAMFPGVERGFYIEAGAFDGYTYSCTYALEALGWTGLLVEPLPERAAIAARARPGSRVEPVAIGPPGGPGRVRLMIEAPDRHTQELTSRIVEAGPGRSSPAGSRTVEVACTTLDALLEGHNGPIHAAIIDLEGHEIPALDGFDMDRFRPSLLLVEDHTLRDDSELGRYLTRRGYAHAGFMSYNRVAVRADEPALLERARFLLHEANRGEDQPSTPPDNRNHRTRHD